MGPQEPPQELTQVAPADPFIHGTRLIRETLSDGTVQTREVPLTVEDVLYPQEGDEVYVRPAHELQCNYLTDAFRSCPIGPPLSWVAADWLTAWPNQSIRPMSPDVAVWVGLPDKPNIEAGTLDVPAQGARCILAVEVVSPDRRLND